jgi:hypothetical protein
MKWIVILVGGLVLLVGIIAAIGAMLPRTHVASRTLRVRRPPPDAWTAITHAMASSDVPTDTVDSDPPLRLVSRVKDTEKMFGGTWTVVVAPVADGSSVTITEDGWVANPIFRFVSRFVIGHHATMDAMLKRAAKELSEEPVLSGE